ncbi:MAG: AzlC family ABC transporter permease [Comamonas sp.]
MGVSISVATGLYGISFGALAVASGLSVWQACALSLLMFTGGSQFAFIGVIGGGGAGAAALSAASLLGVRNAVYGMQMAALLGPQGLTRLLAAQLTIDESAATAVGQATPEERRRGFWTAGIGVYVLWNLFTALGAMAGDALGDPRRFGLDGAAVAAFLGLLWPRLRSREPVALAVVSAGIALLAVPWVAPGIPILIAALAGAVWGYCSNGEKTAAPSTDGGSA